MNLHCDDECVWPLTVAVEQHVYLEKLGVPLYKKTPVLQVLQVLLKNCIKVITRGKVSSKDQEFKCTISKQPYEATYESLFECLKKEELTMNQNIFFCFSLL